MTKFKPMHDLILVKPDAPIEKTTGGVLLPDHLLKTKMTGTIMAVGSGRIDEKGEKHPLILEAGQHVTVAKWGSDVFQVDNEECYLIKEEDVIGINS